jgi:hypothetical protein
MTALELSTDLSWPVSWKEQVAFQSLLASEAQLGTRVSPTMHIRRNEFCMIVIPAVSRITGARRHSYVDIRRIKTPRLSLQDQSNFFSMLVYATIERIPHSQRGYGLPTMQKTLREKSRNMVAKARVGRACDTGECDA